MSEKYVNINSFQTFRTSELVEVIRDSNSDENVIKELILLLIEEVLSDDEIVDIYNHLKTKMLSMSTTLV